MSQSEQKAAPADLAVVAPAEVNALAMLTLKPEEYVAQVFEPFRAKLATIKAEADTIHFIDNQMYDAPHRYVDIGTTAGMALAVKMRAALRREVRLDAEDARVARKAPILLIGKLLDSTYKAIVDESTPYETKFDEAIKAEEKRKADIKAEAERIASEIRAALRASINLIVGMPVRAAGQPSLVIFNMLGQLAARDVTTEGFGDLTDEAVAAVNAAGTELNTMYETALAAEKAAAEREAAAAIERARVEEQAIANKKEAERLAALQREAEAAQAERDRIAAETQKKLDDQAAEIAHQRRADEESRKAAEADLAARMKAFEAAQQKELDHAEALNFDLIFNMQREAEKIMMAGAVPFSPGPHEQAHIDAENAATALQTIPVADDEPAEQVGAASLDAQEQHLVGAMRTAIWELMSIVDETVVRREIEIALADFALVSA